MFDMGESLTQQIYRGKDYSTDDWVYGYLLVRKKRCFIATTDALDFMVVHRGKATMKLIEVDPDTVGIYTLHNDWYDIKVFTGDVLETVSGPGSVYSSETRMLVLYNRHAGMYYADGLFVVAPYEFRYCRIVGNIYDDPELFETVNLDESYVEEATSVPEAERLWQLAMDSYEAATEAECIDPSTYRRDHDDTVIDDEDELEVDDGGGRWVAGNFVRYDGVVAREYSTDEILPEDEEDNEED